MGDCRMKPAFGEKANIETAKENGDIDNYDLLLLNNGEIGWIDGKNNTIINTPRTQNDTVTTNGMKIESGKTLDEIVQLFTSINDNSFIELSDNASAERFVKYISPSFAIGTYYQIKLAIAQGIITHPTYVFYPERNELFFIDSDLEIHAIKGYDQLSLSLVDELPDENIEENTIYICDNAGYLYLNSEFVKIFQCNGEESNNNYATQEYVIESIEAASSNYATAEQGLKADTAVQDITSGEEAGAISVDGKTVPIAGLGSAAYEDISPISIEYIESLFD